MQVGDLVRIVNEWRGHNPWMKFPDDQPKIGLIIGVSPSKAIFWVLIGGREILLPLTRLEALCK